MAECNSIEHNFHEIPNMYPNLSANISNDQQLLNFVIDETKSVKLKIILLQR